MAGSATWTASRLHYYTLPTGEWDEKGTATGFAEDEWIATLRRTLRMDELHHQARGDHGQERPGEEGRARRRRVGHLVRPEPGTRARFPLPAEQLRDAVVAALNFNIFDRHADRVRMANIAQMVNVLQAMILTDEAKMVLTPTYHVFQMYIPFQGATYLPTEITTPDYALGKLHRALGECVRGA